MECVSSIFPVQVSTALCKTVSTFFELYFVTFHCEGTWDAA